jgi:thiol-disulfide isomerase/thioredoxin
MRYLPEAITACTRAATGAALLALGLTAGCTGGPATNGDISFVAGSGTVTVVPAADRAEPVALSGTTLAGDPLDLATLRGQPVVINVWGSWCGPCITEAPDLQAAYTRLRAEQVSFVGINTRDNRAAALAFERTHGIGYPSLVDEGAQMLALRGAVPPSAIPSTLVIDKQGRIAARVSGPATEATLVGLVDDVLAEGDTG